MTPLLLNAARAFAMVSFRRRQAGARRRRSASPIWPRSDPCPGTSRAMPKSPTPGRRPPTKFTPRRASARALIAIRTEITDAADKAVLMRVAQAAVVADGKLEAQENRRHQLAGRGAGARSKGLLSLRQ